MEKNKILLICLPSVSLAEEKREGRIGFFPFRVTIHAHMINNLSVIKTLLQNLALGNGLWNTVEDREKIL